jgi:hypothetical protein
MEFILSKIMHRPKKEKEGDNQQTCPNQSMTSEIEKVNFDLCIIG